MSNELMKVTATEAMHLGKAFYESKLFKDVTSAQQAVVKIMAGAEIGIPPFAAMSGIHIIQGKPTIGAGLMASTIKGSGKYDYRVIESSETKCSIDFYEVPRRGIIMKSKDGREEEIPGMQFLGNSTFTIEDAKRAGTQNLQKFPKNMLFARAISNGVKWFTPDIFSGPVYTPEEFDQPTQDAPAQDITAELSAAISEVYAAEDRKGVVEVWTKHKQFQTVPEFIAAKDQMKLKFPEPVKQ